MSVDANTIAFAHKLADLRGTCPRIEKRGRQLVPPFEPQRNAAARHAIAAACMFGVASETVSIPNVSTTGRK